MKQPTQEQLTDLWAVAHSWVDTFRVSCAESFYDSDRVVVALPELGETICDVIGYYQYQDRDNDDDGE